MYKVVNGSIFVSVKFYAAYVSRDQLVILIDKTFKQSLKVCIFVEFLGMQMLMTECYINDII